MNRMVFVCGARTAHHEDINARHRFPWPVIFHKDFRFIIDSTTQIYNQRNTFELGHGSFLLLFFHSRFVIDSIKSRWCCFVKFLLDAAIDIDDAHKESKSSKIW